MNQDHNFASSVGTLIEDGVPSVSRENFFAPTEEELEAVTRELVKIQKVETALARWRDACPPDMQSSNFDDPRLVPSRAAIDRVLSWQCPSPKGILASGKTGLGKSRSMWALMHRLASAGLDVRFYHAQDWFTALQEQIRYGRDEARGWVEAVAQRQIVFIDDLGQEAVQTTKQEWAQGWFFRFLDIRLGHKLPLFITTNLTADAMATSANVREASIRADPLIRRILELCDPVKF